MRPEYPLIVIVAFTAGFWIYQIGVVEPVTAQYDCHAKPGTEAEKIEKEFTHD